MWYLRMPLMLIALLAGMNAWLYTYDIRIGAVVSIFVIIYSVCAVVSYFYSKTRHVQEMVDFAADYAQVQKQLIKDLELPYGLMDKTGRIMWMNKEMERVIAADGFKYIFTLYFA